MITMSDSNLSAPAPAGAGKHYSLFKENFSDCFQTTSPDRARALARTPLKIEQWHRQDATLKDTNKAAWHAQNQVDRALNTVQDAYAFGAPLLQARLKEKYGVVDDVRTTWLHLYIPRDGLWGITDPLGSTTTRTVSLIDAALHNFAANEAFEEKDSAYISQPDARGQFTLKPVQEKMTIKQFQALCRELDLGKQYRQHLQDALLPRSVVARQELKEKVIDSEKATFTTAAAMALLKGDISANAHDVVTGLLAGRTGLTLIGKVTEPCDLSLLGTTLTGILIFGAVSQQITEPHPIVVYVPHDPEHPMKEYASWPDFVRELSRQLFENATASSSQMTYRQFFSQFVDQAQRGHFFAALDQRLSTLTWHPKEPLDQRPSWRPAPVLQPDLQYVRAPFSEDIAERLYQRKLDKILKDAGDIVIATADADSHARKAWWDNALKIVADIFNAALLVVTPFVPVLGELMLAYTAYQLGGEVITGVIDLVEGQWVEATEHLIGVLNELAQLAAVGAGFVIGKPLLTKFSGLVDSMIPVRLASGESRLWHADLTPYERPDIDLPNDAKPDATGLHTHQGKTILRVANKHYEVSKEGKTARQRIQHPTRTEAYQPEVALNGKGAYVIEGEQPRTWDDATLLRRIGPAVHDLSNTQLETVRKISGTDPGELRRMYVENREPPALLMDTITRLDIDQDLQLFIEQMNSDDPKVYGQADPVTQLQVMTRHGMWPPKAAMRVIDGKSETIWEYTDANAPNGKKLIVQLQERQLRQGELLKSVMETLDENGTAVILDQAPDTPVQSLDQRLRTLRKRIATVAKNQRTALFNEDYASRQAPAEKHTALVRDKFPDIPAQGIKRLLATATKAERQVMSDEGRLPLRLKRIAQALQLEARTARAYEGFYRETLVSADTERLALNALRLFSDTLSDLRIEIRADSFDGELSCKAGPADASILRILVRGKSAAYEVRDSSNKQLHEAADLYQAILQALPDEKLGELGYRTDQGAMFKQWVMVKNEFPAQRRTALAVEAALPPTLKEDLLLLRGPGLSRAPRSVDERVTDLYPHFSEREANVFVKSLTDTGDAVEHLNRLEKELDDLRLDINTWKIEHLMDWGPDSVDFINRGGRHIADQLLECFERKASVFGQRATYLEQGYALDLSTEFSSYNNLESWWKKLPVLNKYLDQITTLNLDNTSFSTESAGLLKDFRQLRHFSARQCGLSRLPQGVGKMRLLQTLRLSDNHIQLTPADVESLRNLTRLETLRLDNNPLGTLINVERMPRLSVLSLNNTGMEKWPEGIFSKRRPRSFFLDMQQTPLTQIPDVIAGSDQAFIVARTRLYSNSLSDANRIAYEDYRKSVGISPHIYYSKLANRELAKWPVSTDTIFSSEEHGLGAYRPEAWSDLAMEAESEGFFAVIEKLRESADYRAGGVPREQLADRVWQMIDAAYLDPVVRDDLFTMSTAPTTCADAGAQLFNNMGIKVLVAQAYSYSTSAADLQTRLVTLAKGAARLERVNEIARADIASRTGTPDEVEVHLAYETGLARRLDLPWQSDDMLYQGVSGVTEEAVAQAYSTVVSREEGDGLVNAMLDQPFWIRYLHESHPGEFKNNETSFQEKVVQLENLREVQQAWADGTTLAQAEKTLLREQLKNLAHALSLPESVVFTGDSMTDQTYERLYNDIGEDELELGRKLTRGALKKAGL
jgi:hypothetical protein